MRLKKKWPLHLGIFIIIFIIIYWLLQSLLMPVWINYGALENETYYANGIYHEESETIDILFLGSSHVYCGISPYELYNEYGFSSFVCASSEQPLWVSYYKLLEAKKTQSPQIVALDISSLFRELPYLKEGFNRSTFDYMPLSINKIETLKASLGPDEDIFSYIFPLVQYHDRWGELEEKDFQYLISKKESPNKGYSIVSRVQEYDDRVAQNAKTMQTSIKSHEITEKNRTYFEKIVQYCENEGMELFVYKIPSLYGWDSSYSEIASDFLSNYGLEFYDLQFGSQYLVDIDWTQDSCDLGNHLNIRGAEKTSKVVGTILSDKYMLEDHRRQDKYKKWDDGLSIYLEKKAVALLQSEKDALEYIKMLDNPDYIVFIAVRDDMAYNFDREMAYEFQQLGFESDFIGKYHYSFLGILSKGRKKLEILADEYLNKSGTLNKQLCYSLTSGGYMNGDYANITVNNVDYALNYRGTNIVVFDAHTNTLLDSACIDFYDNRTLYHNWTLLNNIYNMQELLNSK